MSLKLKLAVPTILAGIFFTSHSIAGEVKNMTVFKTPWCGCCQVWTEAMKKAGFKVTIKHLDDLSAIRKQASVTDKFAGCHTAVLGEYVLEGHVPLQAIDKLLTEKPAIRGLSVPGMPSGSLGMGYDMQARYAVFSFKHDPKIAPEIFYRVGS
ncbi:MAG: DUF411 domain-containing protein [Rhizobiaceae bacterium]|nr:DUF411 domain-containing protein [Rhizobiaceae bacterium]